ncbi:hypothetical protein BHECKSOX_989 [Bathymodiolus heckerae thiotrophic gill symbiont]|uniref:hypothetical protein n=1 Tax=Bathymodiolus heckerae thiotrophic gill symbiont TaxID=1052212 RepID=UPI0010B00D1A|nr:hypothetical protein [Bathymodiolus heckerae thiotrophic gill symbiont]SHN90831.1 hypothetical protein BHECKSOX_989 [Bathymodiolus heckerae thiotrophic gill symbiont]
MDDSSITVISFIFIVLTIFWTVRGLVQIFQRHNSILVVLYIIFLFPVAYIHMFILGIFGSSKKERILKKAKEKVQFDKFVEQEKNK